MCDREVVPRVSDERLRDIISIEESVVDGPVVSEKARLAYDLRDCRTDLVYKKHLVEKLTGVLQVIWEYYEDDVPPHDCDFILMPETGRCSIHEAWADLYGLILREE
jgi:hypothetical protein